VNIRLICQEPFRLFFPIGLLVSIAGVSLWPLLYAEQLSFHPAVSHARLMIHGFVGSFVIGFLGTAGPRMLSAPHLTPAEVIGLLIAISGGVLAHLSNHVILGDSCFLALFAAFALMLLIRVVRLRKDTPPPGFVLVGLGLLSMIIGTSILLWESSRGVFIDPFSFAYKFPRLLAYEAFLTLPVLGIAPFLLPRFFGKTSEHNFPETLAPGPDWKRRMALASLVGTLLIAGWALEAAGHLRIARFQQLLVAGIWIFTQIPGLFRDESSGTMRWSARFALFCLVAGLGAAGLAPAYRIPVSHLLYISGFGLFTLTVATRVIFGHAELETSFNRRQPWLITVIALVVAATATRISAEFWPQILISHHNYAALLWILAAGIWAVVVLPKVARS
jgi:uncharacterized protein involved in response to NO